MAVGITQTKTLRMTFETQAGSSYSISINNPKDGLTLAEVEAAMDVVITQNTFNTPGGDLVDKRDVKIIDQTINDMYDEEEE